MLSTLWTGIHIKVLVMKRVNAFHKLKEGGIKN